MTPTSTTDANPLVWIWQRRPLSTALEKFLIPADSLPTGTLPLLQHRYVPGDRVVFTPPSKPISHYGTVVQDQGLYLAINGQKPSDSYTISKLNARPDGVPLSVTPPVPDVVGNPNAQPTIVHNRHTATAHWNVGTPDTNGSQAQARLHVSFWHRHGFLARLSSVTELRHRNPRRERRRPTTPVVVHLHPATRPSQHATRECLHAAITIIRDAVSNGESAVSLHFTTSAPALGPRQ
ncbi:hypothetical protein GCM10022222_84360 [Amycolatopsis ultiminotia]|uniref:LRAT domain-containing protein n=1 Tax=Amycolatopsis ultiminotia TaxID=543629 RepID=A0ABP6YNC0_9PSEU